MVPKEFTEIAKQRWCEKHDYNFTSWGCHKIHDVEDYLSWKQAREVCQNEGTDLAVIESQAEADVSS